MNSREDLNKPSPVVRRRSVVLTAEYKCSHKQRLSVENIHIMSSLPQIIKGALTSPEAGRHEGEGGTGEPHHSYNNVKKVNPLANVLHM